MDNLDKRKYVFGKLFLLANRMQAAGDRLLGGEITLRQWLLTAAVANMGEAPPTLGEAADYMGTSRQNVKQLALKLAEKGFLSLEKDDRDFRETHLRLTGKVLDFWDRAQEEVTGLLEEMFRSFSDEETEILYRGLSKLYGSTRIK